MVFHVRWISHHSSPNLTFVARDSGGIQRLVVRKIHLTWKTIQNPSHMENHTKSISHGKPHKIHLTWKTIQNPSHMENHTKSISHGKPYKIHLTWKTIQNPSHMHIFCRILIFIGFSSFRPIFKIFVNLFGFHFCPRTEHPDQNFEECSPPPPPRFDILCYYM